MKTKKRFFLLALCALIFVNVQTANAQVTIGAENAPQEFSVLELVSTTSGLRLPQFTLSQRNTLTAQLIALTGETKKLAKGLTIYNVDTNCTDTWNGTKWISACSTVGQNNQKCGAYLDGGVWLEFMCHNLGADESLDPFTPTAGLHGAKYRFGMKNPSYTMEQDQSNSGSILDWDSSNSSAFPFQESEGDWLAENNPCPNGWRLPTRTEWLQVINPNNNALTQIGTWTADNTNYESGLQVGKLLFLPACGQRGSDGTEDTRGERLNYWSVTYYNTTTAHKMYATPSVLGATSVAAKWGGNSIRCVAK